MEGGKEREKEWNATSAEESVTLWQIALRHRKLGKDTPTGALRAIKEVERAWVRLEC